MASEVTKVSVFDDRIIQSKPKYAVEKGALSLTNSPYSAIAATTSQQSFNIIVPSENVFVDRAVDWTCDLYFQFVVTPNTTAGTLAAVSAIGTPLCVIGRDVSLAPFPLHQCVNTMSATINDTTTVINTADVLNQVLRLTDYAPNRAQRTGPYQLDKYLHVNAFSNSSLRGYEQAHNTDEVPNGAFAKWTWTSINGTDLPATGSYVYVSAAGATTGTTIGTTAGCYAALNGIPISDGANAGPYTLYAKVSLTEKLVLPPFIFADAMESHTGLFGVQNIQMVINLQNPSRLLRNALVTDGAAVSTSKTISSVAYNSTPSNGAWQNCKLNVQYLTPSLDVPLPPRSILPYQEFPRYISNVATVNAFSRTTTSWQSQTLQTQTITLPSIPDLLMIYVKPVSTDAYMTPLIGDFVMPVKNISVNFDNFSGLLSSHTQQELYKMSVQNGLNMDWSQWSGAVIAGVPTGETSITGGVSSGNVWTTGPGTGAGGQYGTGIGSVTAVTGVTLPSCGGPLVLKPSRDIVLQAGQAPGLVGNFTFQANVTFDNYSGATSAYVYIIAVNSGFFETIKGSSRIIKGVLTEQDIISAPSADAMTMGALRRLTGGAMLTASSANAIGNTVDRAAVAPARPQGATGRSSMSAYT